MNTLGDDCGFDASTAAYGTLTGHSLAEWLGRNHPNIPLLLTSASRTEADKVTTSDKRRFIAKPYELGEVDAQLEAILKHTPRQA